MNENYWGRTSKSRIITCNPKLQLFAYELIKWLPKNMDTTVLCGWRDEEAQHIAFHDGASTKIFPDSKHNVMKEGKPYSQAIDLAPYKIDWQDKLRFARLTGFSRCVVAYINQCVQNNDTHRLCMAIPKNALRKANYIIIRCGDDFDGDGRSTDESFIDQPHIELVNP